MNLIEALHRRAFKNAAYYTPDELREAETALLDFEKQRYLCRTPLNPQTLQLTLKGKKLIQQLIKANSGRSRELFLELVEREKSIKP